MFKIRIIMHDTETKWLMWMVPIKAKVPAKQPTVDFLRQGENSAKIAKIMPNYAKLCMLQIPYCLSSCAVSYDMPMRNFRQIQLVLLEKTWCGQINKENNNRNN